MKIFTLIASIGITLLTLALLLAMVRFFKGPKVADRITAFDLIAATCIGIIAIFSVITEDMVFMDVALALSLIAFLSSVFFAYYLVRKR